MESELINKARAYAEKVFADDVFERRVFHNLEHTQGVVMAATEIGEHTQLTTDEMESVLVAAWFHDTGYQEGSEDHESKAAAIAHDLLRGWGASSKKIQEITDAIQATKMPQQPRSVIAKVLCDADLYHLSTKECASRSAMLRQEWEVLENKKLTDDQWYDNNLHFLESHRYHTFYGQTVLQQGKKKNIKKLRKQSASDDGGDKVHSLKDEVEKLQRKLEKAQSQKPDRGIETMFRTTSSNHVMLSQMVDNKANILLTINSIILSVVVSVLIRKLEENQSLIIPTILLVTVCLATTVFAILATRPNVSSGKFNLDDVKNKRTNLLFFGNFHAMKIEDYEWSVKEMMRDSDYLYGSMIKDIYYLGKVLGKKYRRLRIAYNIFMFGFVIAVMSFIVALMMSPKL